MATSKAQDKQHDPREETADALSEKRAAYDGLKPVDRRDSAVAVQVVPSTVAGLDDKQVQFVPDGQATTIKVDGKTVVSLDADALRGLYAIVKVRVSDL